MEETILKAADRTMPPKECRKAGFTPGAIYGDSVESTISVQFETAALNKILAVHGPNAKVWVKYGRKKKFGIIKEVQRHPVSAKVIHTDVYLIAQDHEVKMQIPILFEGRDNLNNALLQVQKSEIDVMGKVNLMPDSVAVDVSKMSIGDTITAANFDLDKKIKIMDNKDEVYGVITPQKELIKEPEAAAVAETVTPTETEAETKE